MDNLNFKFGSVEIEFIPAVSILATQTEISHNLGKIPTCVIPLSLATTPVFESASATSTKVKLTSNTGTVTANIIVISAPNTH